MAGVGEARLRCERLRVELGDVPVGVGDEETAARERQVELIRAGRCSIGDRWLLRPLRLLTAAAGEEKDGCCNRSEGDDSDDDQDRLPLETTARRGGPL